MSGPYAIYDIPEKLSIVPKEFSQKPEDREKFLRDKNCYFESSYGIVQQKLPVQDSYNFPIDNPTQNTSSVSWSKPPPLWTLFDGVTLFCEDKDGAKKNMGMLDSEGKLHFADQYADFIKDNTKENSEPTPAIVGENYNMVSCREAGTCITDLEKAVELAEGTLPILWQLKAKYKDLFEKR